MSPDPEPSLPRSSLGWAIDAGGLHRALVSLWRRLGLPLLVTENGVADEDDRLRPGFLADHLGPWWTRWRTGADVRGYLYWTGFDNFEWLEGYTARFGLVAVDRVTLERHPKPSAELFARICRTRLIPPTSGTGGRGRRSSAPPP